VGRKIRFDTPMLFSIAFLFQFLIAGLTGIMLAARPSTGSSTIPTFVIAHFPLRAGRRVRLHDLRGVYYWFPKGHRPPAERTPGQMAFLAVPHRLSTHVRHDAHSRLLGMPRRIYTYEAGRGWGTWNLNLICTLGAAFQAARCWSSCWNVRPFAAQREAAGKDPWDAWTLEWATSSPPPEYNFAEIPTSKAAGRFGTSNTQPTRLEIRMNAAERDSIADRFSSSRTPGGLHPKAWWA
jgi:cytochrome c oxidase subunit I